MLVSTDCRRYYTAKEASKLASALTYLKLEVINPVLNQTVVSLSFVIEAERKDHKRKKDTAWGSDYFQL